MSNGGLHGAWIGTVCLIILVFQNSLFFLATHEGRIPDKEGHTYFAPSMVVLVELFKAAISYAILFITQYKLQAPSITDDGYVAIVSDTTSQSLSPSTSDDQSEKTISLTRHSRTSATFKSVSNLLVSKSAWRLSIPATLYVIQTNLAVIGAQNLDATTFMIASQLKFAATALCTSFMLKRVIGFKRWISLGTLSLGVIMVQLASQAQLNQPSTSQAAIIMAEQAKHRNPILGIISILVACFISGFASVFLEKILKNGTSNLWATNIQLGVFGLIPAALPCIIDSFRNGIYHPYMYFGFWAWTTVGANVMGGLVVALIMKYSDNVQKSLAISASMVVTFLICVGLGRAEFETNAMIGSTIVITSIVAYNRLGQSSQQSTDSSKSNNTEKPDEELLKISVQRDVSRHRNIQSTTT